jgi:cephalosporin hydroxylase
LNELERFADQRREAARQMANDVNLRELSLRWFVAGWPHHYSHNFTWMGRPIIQYPQDLVAIQEIVWRVQPQLIVGTGVAHGGTTVFFASLLELLGGNGRVLGIDIEIRPRNRRAIEEHPLFPRITLLEGSSTDPGIVTRVQEEARARPRVLVVLDSMHTHEHVLAELHLYAPLVPRDSYLIVQDTLIEDLPADLWPDRPWGPGNSPKTAVREFLCGTDRFEVDRDIENKLLLTVAPGGYLRCVKD